LLAPFLTFYSNDDKWTLTRQPSSCLHWLHVSDVCERLLLSCGCVNSSLNVHPSHLHLLRRVLMFSVINATVSQPGSYMMPSQQARSWSVWCFVPPDSLQHPDGL